MGVGIFSSGWPSLFLTGDFRPFTFDSLTNNWFDPCCAVLSAQLFCDAMDCILLGSSVHAILQAKNKTKQNRKTGVCCHFLILPDPRIPMQGSCVHHWQVDSLPLSHLPSPSLLYVTFLFVLLGWVRAIVASDSEF